MEASSGRPLVQAQAPEWKQQARSGESQRSLGRQAGGPNSANAPAPLLPLDVGKESHLNFSARLPSPYGAEADLDDDAVLACRTMCVQAPCIRIWRQQQARAFKSVLKFVRP